MSGVDVAAIRALAEPWTKLCPSCDAGLPASCTCREDDPRLVIGQLLDALAEAERQRDDALARVRHVQSLADVVARLQSADPDTHDRNVSWLALLDALDPDDAALADPEPTQTTEPHRAAGDNREVQQ